IFRYSGKKASSLDLPVEVALQTAIFQIRYLERIPAYAAVHDSVELVKTHQRAAAGFVNAVLRKVNREPVRWPDPAIGLSCPEWLLARWKAHFGAEAARGIAAAALTEPAAYLRIAPGSASPEHAELELTPVSGAYRLLSPVQTGMRLHDIGSQ